MDTSGAAVCKDKKLGQMALQQKMLTSTIYLVGLFLSLQLYYKKLNADARPIVNINSFQPLR